MMKLFIVTALLASWLPFRTTAQGEFPVCEICGCSTCPDGFRVNRPEGVVPVPLRFQEEIGLTELSCSLLEEVGLEGSIPPHFCVDEIRLLPELRNFCNCPPVPSSAPTTNAPTTNAPTMAPTTIEAPTGAPMTAQTTDAPIETPSGTPIVAPSGTPIVAPSTNIPIETPTGTPIPTEKPVAAVADQSGGFATSSPSRNPVSAGPAVSVRTAAPAPVASPTTETDAPSDAPIASTGTSVSLPTRSGDAEPSESKGKSRYAKSHIYSLPYLSAEKSVKGQSEGVESTSEKGSAKTNSVEKVEKEDREGKSEKGKGSSTWTYVFPFISHQVTGAKESKGKDAEKEKKGAKGEGTENGM
jgi:hypothetical protein